MKIANHWFDRKKVSDQITLIYEPHVHEFVRCNIWHIRGRDADLLIDSGSGVSSLRTEISDLIDKPMKAVASHIHFDHVGNLHEFEHRIMHHCEAPRMKGYQEFASLSSTELLADIGLTELASYFADEWIVDAIPTPDYQVHTYSIQSTEPTQTVTHGDMIDLGNVCFEVLHLPGHSPGSIGLWDKRSGTLFSGDAIYNNTLLDELADSNIEDYVNTMKTLQELPVTVVHGGHDSSFGRERYLEIIDEYLKKRG